MPTATPTPTTTTAAATTIPTTTTRTAAAATTTAEGEEEVPDFNTTQQQQHHHQQHHHQQNQHQHQLTAQMGDPHSSDVGSAAAAVAAAFDTSNGRWAMAEYEHFLRGLDHIGNGWVLVQKLLVPPRSVNQTHANAKERRETYGDSGQHRSVNDPGESKDGDEDCPRPPARRGVRAGGPLPPYPLQAARTGAGTFTATRIQPPPPALNAHDDRYSATPPPPSPAGADAASAMSANAGDGGGGGGGVGMNFVFTLWLGFVRDRPGRTGCQQAVKRFDDTGGFRVHYVCRDLFGLL